LAVSSALSFFKHLVKNPSLDFQPFAFDPSRLGGYKPKGSMIECAGISDRCQQLEVRAFIQGPKLRFFWLFAQGLALFMIGRSQVGSGSL